MQVYFVHPKRFPRNVKGPFYSTGHPSSDDPKEWCADCLWCGAPEMEAPQLLAELNDDNFNTYFVRQPEEEDEIEEACNALKVCCTEALRYAGKDRSIIEQLGNDPTYCDFIIEGGDLKPAIDSSGEWTNVAIRYYRKHGLNLGGTNSKRWWQFWK